MKQLSSTATVPMVVTATSQGVLVKWLKPLGAAIAIGEPMLEWRVGATTATLNATHAGVISQWFALAGDLLVAGRPLALIADEDVCLKEVGESVAHWGAPNRSACELDFITGARSAYPRHRSIHRCFEDQARLSPHAPCLGFQGESLDYATVNSRANRLARQLIDHGLKPGMPTGIFVSRSPDLIIGFLAILKAGGIYLPLDPENPSARLAYFIEDSGTRIVVCQSELAPRLKTFDVDSIRLDGDLAQGDDSNLSFDGCGDSSAYIIYTSGSTGKPKGILIPHRGVLRLVYHADFLPVQVQDVVIHSSTAAFDAATLEIWGALLNGAQLAIAPKEIFLSVDRLAAFYRDEKVSITFITTGLFNQFASQKPDFLKGVRLVMSGGEAMAPQWVASVLESSRPGQLFNLYGPTENTAISTYHLLAPRDTQAARIPIGKPIANSEAMIMDRQFQPSPIGSEGELCLGGDGLAQAYWRRPALTAEKFVPHPHSDQVGARLYRSGDLVKREPHGPIQFLRRIDSQIKLRGFRIELGEIDAVLSKAPTIANAIIKVFEDDRLGARLAAYIVGKSGARVDPASLRDYLLARLPAYMVPSHFIALETLPLNANGKVDRKLLPEPDWSQAVIRKAYVAPRGDEERRIATICGAVLQIDKIGIHDCFFDLGAHSLLAAKILRQIQAELGISLSLRTFFLQPTIAGLASATHETSESTQPPIEIVRRDQPLPLSFAQQRLWFIDRLTPANPAYHIFGALMMTGQIQAKPLGEALADLIHRHESLRTYFQEQDGTACQWIQDQVEVPFECVDLRTLPPSQRQAAFERLALKTANHPFDLGRAPLFNCRLVTLEENRAALLYNLHHIIADGWSLAIFMTDLWTLYRQKLGQTTAELTPLPVQYADFAQWQRQSLEGKKLEQHLAFWVNRLGPKPATLALATDFSRPNQLSYRGATFSFKWDGDLTRAVHDFNSQQGVTMFMTLLAGYQMLLHRYSNQNRIWVGTPIANRQNEALEAIIGFFVNTLVMQAEFSPNLSFRQLVAQVKANSLAAFEHQDLPFDKLVEVLAPDRDLSRNPLVQAVFAFQNIHQIDVKGLHLDRLIIDRGLALFDLLLDMEESDGQLGGFFEYSTDLFEKPTITRMATQWQTLFRAAIDQPDQPLDQLPLLERAAQDAIVFGFNQTKRTLPPFEPIAALIARRAETHGNALALRHGDQALDFTELNRRANQLAWALIAEGVGPETVVASLFPPGLEKTIAELAILKSGGAYVPLDPNHPDQRLILTLEDVGAIGCLSLSSLISRMGDWQGFRICCDRDSFAAHAQTNPPLSVTPLNLALVIYTSGSTGKPKGVQLHQHAIFNFCHWQANGFNMQAGERWAATAGPAFDAGSWDLWPNLVHAVAVIFVDEQTRLDPIKLWGWFAENRIDGTFCATPLAEALMQESHACKGYPKRLITGGDRLRQRPKANDRFSLVNAYGPSETMIVAAMTQVDPEPTDQLPNIGTPIDNGSIYICDRHLQPQPIGVAGELLIGGFGVARGYQQRPGLTAEKFIPNPFASTAGERVYRTGDLARYLAGGEIAFIGRVDFQVQIRGIRMELGEIEHALTSHDRIKHSLVLARDNSQSELYLVAYAVADGEPPAPEELIAFLGSFLPTQAIPKNFIFLDTFPLTANGKIDRGALPEPCTQQIESRLVVAGTQTEKALATIWAALLERDPIGIHDNFFSLGGHSLLVAKVLARIRSQMGLDLPIRTLFEHPTIATLARLVDSQQSVEEVVIAKVDRSQPLPLSFAQQRIWFLDQLEPASPAYNIPLAFRLRGTLDLAALEWALARLIARYEPLRTSFTLHDDKPVQVIHPSASTSLVIHDLVTENPATRDDAIQAVIDLEARTAFDLSQAPLCRFLLIKRAVDDQDLAITIHHIVADGWSVGLIMGDLDRFYQQYAQRDGFVEEPLAIQYADFAVWQKDWLQGDRLNQQEAFWRDCLGDGPPPLDLPTDYPRGATQGQNGRMLTISLPKRLREPLYQLAQSEGATPFMVLLALFKVLLHHHARQTDICVGTPVANRNHIQLESLVGLFVNTLVLRTQLQPGSTFLDLLAQVRKTALDAFAHSDMPFEKLVATLNPDRQTGANPFFQVMFSYQNQANLNLSLGELAVERVATDRQSVHFDLTFDVEDYGDTFTATFEYDADLYAAPTLTRWGRHFIQLMETVQVQARQPIDQYQMLDPDERQLLLQTWNSQERYAPTTSALHTGFEVLAAAQPQKEALLYQDRVWTYVALDEYANRLAHYLRQQGVEPGDLVGVCMPRRPELIGSLLAIFKIGGAYVPLDPAYPPERIAFMLEDTQPKLVLSLEKAAIPFRDATNHIVDLAEIDLASQPTSKPGGFTADPDHIAYLIFTSGSTGKPKGVTIAHKSALALVDWARDAFSPTELNRVLATTSICFDLSIFEIFVPLHCGNAIVLMDSILELPGHPQENQISLINTVPSAMAELVTWEGIPASVKLVNLAGEALQPGLVEQIYQFAHVTRVVNLYGPSEDTTYSTVATIEPDLIHLPPIGVPIRGSQAYVCNRRGHLTAVGIPGELLLGGQGLAYGYWRRPGLTAAKFVPNPFAIHPGERLYLSGDLVRFKADGILDFMGRIDHQVKFRGYRIELGEIEARLMDHPQVQIAVVLVGKSTKGYQQLVGYVQIGSDGMQAQAQIIEALGEQLSSKLPEYMIPSEFMAMASFPLRPNGKVNRDALPDLMTMNNGQNTGSIATQSPLESELQKLWQSLLSSGPPPNPHHSFFKQGGNEWLAIRCIAQVQERFGVQIPLKTFCDQPTIAGLAETIEIARRVTSQMAEVPPTSDDDWEDGEI